MPVDLNLMRSFLALAEELHFGRAASRLHVTQQALSQQIRRLEDQLGEALFERSTRAVALTSAGERLLAPARELVVASSSIDGLFDRTRVVRVARVEDAGFPAELLARALTDDAQLQLSADSLSSGEQIEAVRSGRIDLGWARLTRPVQGLRTELIRCEPVLAVVRLGPGAHPPATVSVAETLRPHPTARYNAWTRYLDALFTEYGGRRSESVRLAGTESLGLRLRSLRRGQHVATLLPDTLAPWLPAGFAVVPFAEVQPYYCWTLLSRPGELSNAARELAGLARETRDERRWLDPDLGLPAEPWLPPDDPWVEHGGHLRGRWRSAAAALRRAEQLSPAAGSHPSASGP